VRRSPRPVQRQQQENDTTGTVSFGDQQVPGRFQVARRGDFGKPTAVFAGAGDMLREADAIAAFLFGDAKQRRRVYHLVQTGSLPHFRLGMAIYGRKSVLLQWIAQQEARLR
jgi:hypothetical protein